MTDNKDKRLRLDEILLYEGQVTEDQIRQALALQKEHGGRLGSHLIRNGWVTEAALVRALARQFECEGVILSERTIPENAIRQIPAKVAVARSVVPFAYDPATRELKIACEDPTNAELQRELSFVARECKIKLFVAAESSLKAAITKYYVLVSGEAPEEVLPVNRYWDTRDDTGRLDVRPTAAAGTRGSVLLVSDDLEADSHVRAILESASFRVIVCDSADDAIDIIGGHSFHTVLVRDTVSGDYLDLIDRLRKISPRTRVRYFSAAEHLLLDDDAKGNSELHVKNLELFTALLSSKDNLSSNHSGTVGQLVDRLCRHIGLPDRDRLVITNAAYIHDLSRFYYGESAAKEDYRMQISLTIKLLDSLNYSPVVVGILRAMYINLREKFTKRLPIETLGGNILTIVDIFCDNVSLGDKMSLDKFDKIRHKLNDLRGKLFLPEVVEAFLEMIQSDILAVGELLRYNQILLFCTDIEMARPVESRLKNEGFRVIVVGDMGSMADLFTRGNPDMIILLEMGTPAKVSGLLDAVMAQGIDVAKTPTFLLTDAYVASQMTSFLDRGVEDLISIDNNLNLLVVKIRKVRARIESQATGPHIRPDQSTVTGALGNLIDMNLIDLLQALGPSRRTVKVVVSDGKDELTLFLNQGQITHARLKDCTGAEAVYQALAWTTGYWNIQPVAAEEIPPPNTEYSNESILMEGCRLLDEKQKKAPKV
jgi:DNA-binding response OmpR family regulator